MKAEYILNLDLQSKLEQKDTSLKHLTNITTPIWHNCVGSLIIKDSQISRHGWEYCLTFWRLVMTNIVTWYVSCKRQQRTIRDDSMNTEAIQTCLHRLFT